MQPLAFMAAAGVLVWLVVYLFVTDGSAIAATVMACAAMFAVLMLKLRESEGMAQRGDPVRVSSVTPRQGVPEGIEPVSVEGAAEFRPQPPQAYPQPFTLPTPDNPLMNVLPPNDGVYGNRPPAAPAFNRQIEQRINDVVVQDVAGNGMLDGVIAKDRDVTRSKLYMDLGGEIDLADSMRVFGATPATTMPNDQTGFAEFCYGAVGSCARGGELFCAPEPVPREDRAGAGPQMGGYKTSGQDVLQPPPGSQGTAGHGGLALTTAQANAHAQAHGA